MLGGWSDPPPTQGLVCWVVARFFWGEGQVAHATRPLQLARFPSQCFSATAAGPGGNPTSGGGKWNSLVENCLDFHVRLEQDKHTRAECDEHTKGGSRATCFVGMHSEQLQKIHVFSNSQPTGVSYVQLWRTALVRT